MNGCHCWEDSFNGGLTSDEGSGGGIGDDGTCDTTAVTGGKCCFVLGADELPAFCTCSKSDCTGNYKGTKSCSGLGKYY